MNASLVIWEVVITNSEIYHTGIEEGMAFLATAIKVSWGGRLDLGAFCEVSEKGVKLADSLLGDLGNSSWFLLKPLFSSTLFSFGLILSWTGWRLRLIPSLPTCACFPLASV